LAAADFPWSQTDAWMVDERFVPDGHADHNGSAIRAILGSKPNSLHLIDTAQATAVMAAERYAADLAAVPAAAANTGNLAALPAAGAWPAFDFMLLGMGADGHTASLFPGTGAVDVVDRAALAVTPLTAPHQRISLSLPVLNAAGCVVFLVTGAAKREMLARVLSGKNRELPASLVDPVRGRGLFLGDTQSFPGVIPM